MHYIGKEDKDMNLFGLVAYAEEAAEGAVQNGQQNVGIGGLIGSFLPLVIIIVLFYFLLIRPQRKRDKETKAMLAAMKVGDKVVTIGGICGKITKIKDTFVYIETGGIGTDATTCVIKMERDAVKSVEKKKSN